jgi:hypothetical protein
MTLFARIIDVAGVAGFLRERHPSVVIDGPDDNWRNATISFGSRTLTFTHDPEYNAEPNWSKQMNGMRGYFARFPDFEAKEKAIMLTTTFKFSLGLLFEPPDYDEADPRLEYVFAVAKLLDGVLFTPSALLDAKGLALFGADGEVDPEAVWPRVIAEFEIDPSRRAEMSDDSQEEPVTAPSPERIARRALALAAVTARALLEQQGTVIGSRNAYFWNPQNWFPRREKQRGDIIEWIELVGIRDEPEPEEWEVLQRPIGRLESRQQINSTWRLEGLVVLAWALGRFLVPPHDKLVSPHPLLASLGVLNVPAAKALLTNPTLRPRSELGKLRTRLFTLQWRLRNYGIRPNAMDFIEFAKTAWFGPLDLTGLPLVKGDLAVAGKRIDRAEPIELEKANSAAHERHLAINWIWEGPPKYSEARTDT